MRLSDSHANLLQPDIKLARRSTNTLQLHNSSDLARGSITPDRQSTNLQIYNSWDFSLPTIPPRSRLFHLEPLGIGTSHVESLTGYIARLADAHSVTPGVLFGDELLPLLDNPYWQNQLTKKEKTSLLGYGFLAQTPTMNGTGKVASQWVKVLEDATRRSGLESVTLLPWREFASTLKLLRRKRAWCPGCYEEWLIRKLPVYEPLIWCVEAVEICVAHRRRLQSICHWCNRQSYLLSTKTRPGFCSFCGSWLGRAAELPLLPNEILSDADLEWATFAATGIGTLLSTVFTPVTRQPTKEKIAQSLEFCIQQFFEGKASILSRRARISKQTITNWRAGVTPRLEALLRVCFHSKVSLTSFLLGTISTVTIPNIPTQPVNSNAPINKQRPPARKLNLKETEQVLKNALTENPPRCLAHVAARLGRRAATFRYHFPDLCKALVDRYAAYEECCLLGRLAVRRNALRAALVDDTHPATIDIVRRLGVQHQELIKEFPDLCKEVSRRHTEARKEKWAKIGEELQAILEERPPPSLGEICERIGYCRTSLRRHHSRLCHRLASRHVKFRHNKLRGRTTRSKSRWKD